jgi:hypothetical protein
VARKSASTAIEPDATTRKAWIETQNAALQSVCLDPVLAALVGHREAPEIEDEGSRCGAASAI